jgi:hypothetical protein
MKHLLILLVMVSSIFSSLVLGEILEVGSVPELQAALDRALPGDIIQLQPGKYTLDQPLVFRKSGLGSQAITVLATDKERTVFTGDKGLVFEDISSIRLENLVFFAITRQPVLRLNSSRGITVTRCEFHKCGQVVNQKKVKDPRVPPMYMEACLVRLCVSAGNLMDLRGGYNRLINNSFETCGGTLRVDGDRNLIRGNYFMGNAVGGLAVQLLGNKDKFLNQYFHQVQAPPGRKGLVEVGPVRHSIFGHTTWYNCSTPVFVIGEEGRLSAMNTFANNLVQNHEAETPPIIQLSSDVVDLMWANNLIYDPAGRSNLVSGAEVKILTGNPDLMEINGVCRVRAGSPAVNAGTSRTGSSMMDIEGRVRGLRPDIGAHEVGKEEPTLGRIKSVFLK